MEISLISLEKGAKNCFFCLKMAFGNFLPIIDLNRGVLFAQIQVHSEKNLLWTLQT